MEAHVPTMFLMIVATSVTLAVSFGSVAYRPDRDGLFFWAAALAGHAVAIALFGLRGQISDVVSIIIANGLLSGVFAMFAEGLYQFQRRAPPRWLIWLPVAAITVSFMFLLHDLRARIVLSAIIFSLQCLILLLAVLEKRRETPGRGQHFLAAGLELALAIFLLRAVGTATGMVETLSMAASNTVQAATYLSSLVGLVLVSLGFVLMTKERADERNQILAIQDELTGLANRRRLNEILAKEWARASRTGQTLALVMLDVDQFKDYNDRYGHQAGDECLRRVARVLQASAQRAGDLAARYGGEEFLLVLANADAAAAMRVAETVRQSVQSLAIAHAQTPEGKVTVSAGVAVMTNASYANTENLLRAADDALYRAKTSGRNQVQLAPEAPGTAAAGEIGSANFVQLVWHVAYACGHATIDAQHRGLFDHANRLLAAILSARPAAEVGALIDALIQAVVRHFKDEEAILAAANYPDVSEHAAIHRELAGRAGTMVSRFHAGTLGVGDVFQFLARDVVARHMLSEDRKFFSYLKTGT